MKRLTKQKKGFKGTGRVNVKAAGIVMAALMGVGSAAGAVGAVNVFAEEESTVETVSQEESVNAAGSLTGSEEAGNTGSDVSRDEAENIAEEVGENTEEKTDESSVQIENTTSTDTEYVKNNKVIQPEKTTEDKKISGVGTVNAVEAVKNGWVKESGGYKYYKNGKAYTGWHKMGKAEGEKKEHWSYFGKNGIVYTGWKKMGKAEGEKTEHWCYFGSNGWLRTGWVQLGKGTSDPDGNVAKHWSYFGSNGWLRTGWVHLGKGTSEPDGNVKKHWSYFGSNGWLRTGWVHFGKGTSEPDGNSAKHWSYFGSNGWLRTGWVQLGKGTSEPDGNSAKHWSYFGDNGWMRTGWQEMGKGTKNPDGNAAKHTSYFGSNGWMRTGNQYIDSVMYSFNDSGWLRDAYYEDGKLFTGILTAWTGRITGFDSYCGVYYKNGKRFTGYFKDFPQNINFAVYDNGKRVGVNQGKFELSYMSDNVGTTNGIIVSNVVAYHAAKTSQDKDVIKISPAGAKGTTIEIKIGNDTYKGKVNEERDGHTEIEFQSNRRYRYFEIEEAKITITATYGKQIITGNGRGTFIGQKSG